MADPTFVQQADAQIPWGHHQVLLDKLDDADTRIWYAAAAVENGWSRNILAMQIEGQLDLRAGQAISNFHIPLPAPDSDLAQQATRDPYLFDFVGNEQS